MTTKEKSDIWGWIQATTREGLTRSRNKLQHFMNFNGRKQTKKILKNSVSCGRKTRGEGWGGGEYVGWREEGCHHFFWGVESFCIPRILSSSSETKSYGERARTETHAGTQNDKYAHQKRSLEEAEGVYEQGSEEGLCFTSVGLKQSTSKSYKTGKNRMK